MKRVIILVIGCFVFCAIPINAAMVEFEVTAEVIEVNDLGGLLQGKIVVGSIIEGSYIFDSDTPDSQPNDQEFGEYYHDSGPFGVSLSGGDFLFQTNPSNVCFGISIYNDFLPKLYDGYVMYSYCNKILYDDIEVMDIKLKLFDYTATALTSDELLLGAPNLEDWERKELLIDGGTFDEFGRIIDGFWITANVTRLVPEPASLMLIGICFLAVVRNRKTRK